MRVTFLGVGAAFSRSRGTSSLLVEAGGVRLLIDCGRTVPGALESLGLGISDITHILITHLHADHIGGLEEVALVSRIFLDHRPNIIATPTLLERLWSASLRGGLEFLELEPGSSDPQTLDSFFDSTPVETMEWQRLGRDLSVRLRPTHHVLGMESFAVEVEGRPGGKAGRILFSGDTRFDMGLIEYGVAHCARVFHDCQLVDSGPANTLGVHTSYNQLLQLPAAIRARLLLYHYGDEALPDAMADGFEGFAQPLTALDI